MSFKAKRGTLEHCLDQGVCAERLLNRFRAVVSAQEMAVVQFCFEELHQKADFFLRQGYELVGVGIDNRSEGEAGPFMLFNPTRWWSSRRELVSPTSTSNPRKWVGIRVRSFTRHPETSLTSSDAGPSARVQAKPLPALHETSSTRFARHDHQASLPVLESVLD